MAASEVLELAFEYLDAPVARLGAIWRTLPGSPPLLDSRLRHLLISSQGPEPPAVRFAP